MKLASCKTFTVSDCPDFLKRKAQAVESSISLAWLAAHRSLQEQGGWYCLDRSAQKALGYTWQKVTPTEPFFHGAWIHENRNGTCDLVIVDRE